MTEWQRHSDPEARTQGNRKCWWLVNYHIFSHDTLHIIIVTNFFIVNIKIKTKQLRKPWYPWDLQVLADQISWRSILNNSNNQFLKLFFPSLGKFTSSSGFAEQTRVWGFRLFLSGQIDWAWSLNRFEIKFSALLFTSSYNSYLVN